MAYASAIDLELRWRPLTGPEKARASELLREASMEIDVVCKSPADGELSGEELDKRRTVACRMVRRALSTPDGPAVTQESQTRGPFSRQLTYANPTGDLYLTKADRRLLGCLGARAGNVSMLGGP